MKKFAIIIAMFLVGCTGPTTHPVDLVNVGPEYPYAGEVLSAEVENVSDNHPLVEMHFDNGEGTPAFVAGECEWSDHGETVTVYASHSLNDGFSVTMTFEYPTDVEKGRCRTFIDYQASPWTVVRLGVFSPAQGSPNPVLSPVGN